MPGTEIETVTLGENIDHPLDAVLAQVDRSKAGPVMIVGLEKSNPSLAKERPVLYALNMSRPEWSKELPRPLVFWIPEYLLGLMGREAPDFLDWRSDTLFFSEDLGQELSLFISGASAPKDESELSEERRRARIEELRSRFELPHLASTDPVILSVRFDWLLEISYHLIILGELEEAERKISEALSLAETLGDPSSKAGALSLLADLHSARGEDEQAEALTQSVISTHLNLGKLSLVIGDKIKLAYSQMTMGRVTEAASLCHEALGQAIEDGNLWQQARALQCLARIAFMQSAWEEAERLMSQALRISNDLGDRLSVAANLGLLALISIQEGDLAGAEEKLLESLNIYQEFGFLKGVADSRGGLGILYSLLGDSPRAYDELASARTLYAQMNIKYGIESVDAILAAFPRSSTSV